MSKPIDQDFFRGWKHHVLSEDEILWEGSSNFRYVIRFLEKDFYHDVATGPTSIFGLYLFVLFYFVIQLYSEHPFYSFLLGSIGFLLPFIYEYIRSVVISKTQYAITKNAVLWKIFSGFSYTIHALQIENIIDLKLIEDAKKEGSIQLISDDKVGFKTYNLQTGQQYDHPTIELINTPQEVFKILSDRITIRRPKNAFYNASIASPSLIKGIRTILSIFIFFMTLYLEYV